MGDALFSLLDGRLAKRQRGAVEPLPLILSAQGPVRGSPLRTGSICLFLLSIGPAHWRLPCKKACPPYGTIGTIGAIVA
jgi:hypothetical protein